MEELKKRMAKFDAGREAAKRDRAIYGRPYPYDSKSEFSRGYKYEWKLGK